MHILLFYKLKISSLPSKLSQATLAVGEQPLQVVSSPHGIRLLSVTLGAASPLRLSPRTASEAALNCAQLPLSVNLSAFLSGSSFGMSMILWRGIRNAWCKSRMLGAVSLAACCQSCTIFLRLSESLCLVRGLRQGRLLRDGRLLQRPTLAPSTR